VYWFLWQAQHYNWSGIKRSTLRPSTWTDCRIFKLFLSNSPRTEGNIFISHPPRMLAVYFSLKIQQGDAARRFSLKGNGSKHGHSLLGHTALLRFRWPNTRPTLSDSKRKKTAAAVHTLQLHWTRNKLTASIPVAAPFNSMRTLRFKAQLTNAFFSTVNQMFGGSSQLSTTAERAVIKSLSKVQTAKQCSAVVGSWEDPPNNWFTVA